MYLRNENISCKICNEPYDDVDVCKPCHINNIKANFSNWTSGNEKVDKSIQEIQLKINNSIDIVFEWIPYSQFDDIKKVGEGGFATVYSAIWKDGPIRQCNIENNEWKGNCPDFTVALKCLRNSQNITDEFLNEVKAYSFHSYSDNILQAYGISQNPDTNEYVMVLQYAEGGNLNDWAKKNYEAFDWNFKLIILKNVIFGFKKIHAKNMVHRDFHGGNVLLNTNRLELYDNNIYISDMGLSEVVDNIDQSKIYGVIPYTAPEVLKGESYTQRADIYSFGILMYLVATGKQPFVDQAHDKLLAIGICNGIRPEITDEIAPKCYIDLMKRCWDQNPDNRPNSKEIFELILLFHLSYTMSASNFETVMNMEKESQHYEIDEQFKKAEEYRKSLLQSLNENSNPLNAHEQAFYASRVLPKFDNIYGNSVEIDFMKLTIKDTNENEG